MQVKTLWVGLLGMSVGAAGAIGSRSHWEAWAGGQSAHCCSRPASTAAACPAHYENGKVVLSDAAEAERLRRALMNGVFGPWFELGRAPTPEEIGVRLKLDPTATDHLMDALDTCGEQVGFGIQRVPDSRLIAVAWPLANVPTGITVTLDRAKSVHARCAIDSLGVSKMMGRKAAIDATTRDGVPLHVEVDGETLVSAAPAGAVVFKGASCDEMLFFSTPQALDAWRREKNESGTTFSLEDAVKHGAAIFGRFGRPAAEAMAR